MSTDQIVQLKPDAILADDNIRHSLKKVSIDTLMDDIEAYGEVHTPIEVEQLSPAVNGHNYRLTVGHMRHAAVTRLNAEKQAGLTLPALVRVAGTPLERLKRQLSENIVRESLSPMDIAVSIGKLKALDMPLKDICKMFSSPTGPKGQMVPASYAKIAMYDKFRELPSAIQTKIHSGLIGTSAAYELTKVDADKRADVLAKAEKDRAEAIEREAKWEARYDAEQKKSQAQKDKEAAIEMEKQVVADELKAAKDEKLKHVAEMEKAFKASTLGPKDEQEKAKIALKAATDAMQAADKLATKKEKELERLTAPKVKSTETAAKAKMDLLAKRNKSKQAGKKISPAEVKKAAKELGANKGATPLTGAEMREFIVEMASTRSTPGVQSIGKIVKARIDGITASNKAALKELAIEMGDVKA